MIIGTINDLRKAIAKAPGDQRINLWQDNVGRILVSKGPWGEDTDFSFVVCHSQTEAQVIDQSP